ncbi:MAG: Ig domain-containing protein, partial [Planctomycetota bacterium]
SGGGPVEVTPMVLPAATEGRPYAATLTAVGGPAPYFWSLAGGALPSGVTLSSSGGVGGTPTQAGAFGFTARAERAVAPAQNDTEDFTLIVAPAPVIVTPDPLPGAVRNEGYFMPLAVSGGVGPFQWALAAGSVLPAGLALDPTGVVHGVPTGSGGSFTVEAMDANGAVASKAFTLAVADPSAGLAVVGAFPAGTVGVPYSAALRAVGGTPPYVWSVLAGALPAWAVLDSATGVVSGTPSAAATSMLELGVTDSAVPAPGSASSGPQTLDVRGFLTVTTVGLPPAAQGQAYSARLAVAGASGPVVWALLDGALPAGVSLDSGTGILAGVPQGTGTASFLVRATDGAGRSAFRRLTLSVGTGSGGAVLGGSTGRECSVASAGSAAPGKAMLGALLAALVSVLFGRRKTRGVGR